MRRHLLDKLLAWKNATRRKPLIVNGARQVGKTWILKEFGRVHFENTAYINLDNNPAISALFDQGYDIQRIILMLQAETGEIINPETTLIIFDEIQECPKALTALKYFCEEAPEYAVAAAGSLLGITVHQGTGYPVGKVSTLDLYPLSFREFLDATGNERLRELIDMGDEKTLAVLSSRVEPLLKQYYFMGGMPEVVQSFIDEGDLHLVQEIQHEILLGYERDISKHLSPKETEFTLAAWDSIPAHLSQENRKFIFGHIREGARARDYRSAITWLVQAGLAIKVPRVSKPGCPLSAYLDETAFKLFFVDVGLLSSMSGLDRKSIIEGNRIYTEFKGALTEQYVCQQLVSDYGTQPFYWSAENSRGEIDFLVQDGSRVVPMEVKAEENLQAKSLRSFCTKYENREAIRLSLSGYRDEGWMKNVPLWAVGSLPLWKRDL